MTDNKFVSYLKAVGKVLLQVLHVGENVAAAEVKTISAIDPALGAAVNLGLNLAITTENAFAAIGKSDGTGTQKLASAVNVGEAAMLQLFKAAGITADTSHVQAFVGHLADALNSLPAPAALLAAPVAPVVEPAQASGPNA